MDDKIKDISVESVNDNLTDQKNETKPNDSENLSQSVGESNNKHRVIHKKK